MSNLNVITMCIETRFLDTYDVNKPVKFFFNVKNQTELRVGSVWVHLHV